MTVISHINNTIANWLAYGQQLLNSTSDSAKLDAQILLAFVLQKEISYLLTWPEKSLEQPTEKKYLTLLKRRLVGEPIAYIVGYKEFWSLPFKVSPATLIPRPDTEILVEKIVDLYVEESTKRCLDLGTGTGAIALAIASEKPSWQIDAIDFSQEVVSLAQSNAENLQLSQVNIFQSDWFSAIENIKYDVIVSNPPYIDAQDKNLSQGDVRFEPKSALVANERGLADIKYIAKQALKYLKPKGTLFFEHGFEQGGYVRDILISLGYEKVQTIKDLNGLDRVTWARFSASSPE